MPIRVYGALLVVPVLLGLAVAQTVTSHSQLTLASASFFGGPGNQAATSITINNSTIHLTTDAGQIFRAPIPVGTLAAGTTLSGTCPLPIPAGGVKSTACGNVLTAGLGRAMKAINP